MIYNFVSECYQDKTLTNITSNVVYCEFVDSENFIEGKALLKNVTRTSFNYMQGVPEKSIRQIVIDRFIQ